MSLIGTRNGSAWTSWSSIKSVLHWDALTPCKRTDCRVTSGRQGAEKESAICLCSHKGLLQSGLRSGNVASRWKKWLFPLQSTGEAASRYCVWFGWLQVQGKMSTNWHKSTSGRLGLSGGWNTWCMKTNSRNQAGLAGRKEGKRGVPQGLNNWTTRRDMLLLLLI